MNSFDVIKAIYKPYRYTIKGKSTIINTTSGDYVIKKRTVDLKSLFSYLQSRSFNNFPKVIDDSRSDIIVYEYVENIKLPIEQKSIDMMNLLSNLHHKTTYFKEVSQDKYKSIYENINSNIEYFKEYYNMLYDSLFKKVYHSPSEYLFIINYYKIDSMLEFCSNELNNWFEIVKEKNTQRVTVVHNNLSLDHYIKANDEYFISWEKYKIDTPVLDLVKLYQNSYLNIDFKVLLERYLNNYNLQDDEKKLFFILISIPPKIIMKYPDEMENVRNIRLDLDYIFKTEDLIRPYYSKQEKEEQTYLY